MREHHSSEYRPLWIFGNQTQVALSLRSPVVSPFPSLQVCVAGGAEAVRSHEESSLPRDAQQGSSRAGRRALFSCIASSGSHTRQSQKEGTLRLGSWEGTEPLDSEWSTVLGIGLYQPGVSVNHSLTSEPRDQ